MLLKLVPLVRLEDCPETLPVGAVYEDEDRELVAVPLELVERPLEPAEVLIEPIEMPLEPDIVDMPLEREPKLVLLDEGEITMAPATPLLLGAVPVT